MRTSASNQQPLPEVSNVPLGSRTPTWVVCALLAVAVWAVFGQTLRYDFVSYDDRTYIYENQVVTRGLTPEGVAWAFTHVADNEWFPLTRISRMLNVEFYGLKPGGHHLTNVLLHAGAAIVLFVVLRRMTGQVWPSAFVAAVFAVHPLRVESVAWVTERKDVLSGLFFMLTLWAYARNAELGMRSAESSSRFTFHVSRYYLLSLLFFTLGLLSKTMLVTVPFVLLLLDYWPLKRMMKEECRMQKGEVSPLHHSSFIIHPSPLNSSFIIRPSLIWEKLPFLLLAVAACVATLVTQPNALAFLEFKGLSLPWRIGNALMAYADYLGHMVYPAGLAVCYAPAPKLLPVWRVVLSALALALISAGALAGWRKRPYLLVGWLWYLGMLLPVIDIMQAGINARADRFTYLPQIGLYLMVAWGVADLCRGWRYSRALLTAAAALTLTVLVAAAHVQTRYWKDSVSLWQRAIACTPGNYTAYDNLGIVLARQGKLDEAIPYLERAVQLDPSVAKTYYNLGAALAVQGKLPEAVQQFERALQLSPNYANAHVSLAKALAAQGKFNEAVPHMQHALRLAEASNNRALAQALRNQLLAIGYSVK